MTLQITNTGGGGSQGGGALPNFSYVAASAVVTGTRDGSFDRPFATIQDAIDLYGVPTTQAEYLAPKSIEVLDTATYTENLTFPTGRWTLNFPNAFIVGNITWELTNTERFGSTQQPILSLLRDVANIVTAVTGNISVVRKAGGTVISLGTLRLAGFTIQNGTVTMADGTNGGDVVFTQAVLSQISVGYSGTSTILARNAFVAFVDSGFNPTLAMEVGSITIVRDSTINSQDISEYLNSTTIRQIRAMQLNNSGGVTFRAIGSVRNWNVDTVSGSEILTKITSYPDNALNLIKPVAEAVAIQDAGNYFTATEVEGALQELGAGVESGTYTPTGTAVTNVSAVTPTACQYLRVGNTVTVSGQVDITATSNNARTTFRLSLPVASDFGNSYEAGGSGYTMANATEGHGIAVYADATNNELEFDYHETHGGTDTFAFTATYQII